MPSAKYAVVTFVLDESGSMNEVKEKTISGFNEYIQTLISEDKDILINLITFNGSGIKPVIQFKEISSVTQLNDELYKPGFTTPLYDAIGQGISATEIFLSKTDNGSDIFFTILTDGYENSSREYNLSQINKLIDEKRNEDWVFTYLGANQDSWLEADKIGIQKDFASDYSYTHPERAFMIEAKGMLRTRKRMGKGMKINKYYTDEDRKELNRK